MKKNKKVYIVLLITLVFFSISLVNKAIQNDTFFYIPIGEYISETHTIDGIDHWSFHSNLRFTYPRMDLQLMYIRIISCLWFCRNICFCISNDFRNCYHSFS